jgi:hypothetical protein
VKLFLHLNGNSDPFMERRDHLGNQDIIYENGITIYHKLIQWVDEYENTC